MKYAVITPVATEPVTSAEAKLHIRVDHNTEDALIASLITAAREYCELFTGRALATQTLEAYPETWGEIDLPMKPVQSVTSIKYTASDGTETTMPETDYAVDTVDGKIILPYGGSWPTETLGTLNPIKVRYVAGYTSAPKTIKQAMLLLVGHWYENREAVAIGTTSKQIEFSVKALLTPYRLRWL